MKKLENLLKIMSLIGQPLVKKNLSENSISDLFIWRRGDHWETILDLINLGAIINRLDGSPSRQVFLQFYSKTGTKLLDHTHTFDERLMNRINLSLYLKNVEGEYGVFTLTHLDVPKIMSSFGASLTDRGYISYCYKYSPINSYVHGNFDAISYPNGDKLPFFLMGTSLMMREYHLQYVFESGNNYEIFFTNPTSSKRKLFIHFIDSHSGALDKIETFFVDKLGVIAFLVTPPPGKSWRIFVKSRLIMARPIVFKVGNCSADVFHG